MDARRMTAGLGGFTFPLPFAAFAPESSQILRAALEAVAFAVRANLEQLESISGRTVDVLRAGGGMSRSPEFLRILADALGRPVLRASTPETSALGAAALAAVAVGLSPSVTSAVERTAGDRCCIEPATRAAAHYEDVYHRWWELCDRFARMAMEV
jgi:sugar (pentulose or hexulose) kinase